MYLYLINVDMLIGCLHAFLIHACKIIYLKIESMGMYTKISHIFSTVLAVTATLIYFTLTKIKSQYMPLVFLILKINNVSCDLGIFSMV